MDYSYVSDILGISVDELGRRRSVDNGSIEAYVQSHKDELRIGGDGKIYPTKSFYIKQIRPILERII